MPACGVDCPPSGTCRTTTKAGIQTCPNGDLPRLPLLGAANPAKNGASHKRHKCHVSPIRKGRIRLAHGQGTIVPGGTNDWAASSRNMNGA